MTEQQIKEALSSSFIEAIACRRGYKCLTRALDNGVDLTYTRVQVIDRGDGIRYLDSGEYIDFQLKSTTTNTVTFEEDCLLYDLEAKTYNDLIDRAESPTPLYLVIFVLPSDESTWLNISHEDLLLTGKAFWYKPLPMDLHTENASRIRIRIPLDNQIESTFFDDCFQEVFG